MSRFTVLEEAIEVASRMKECLATVHDCYERFPSIVVDEHAAIQASSLDGVEACAKRKLDMGAKIDTAFRELASLSERLADVHRKTVGEQRDLANISDCISIFDNISQYFQQMGFGSQVFDHVLGGFKDVFTKFVALRKKTQPLIETNKMVVSKLLANRQENLQFWQEVASEALASYNESGKQQPQKGKSIISVKA